MAVDAARRQAPITKSNVAAMETPPPLIWEDSSRGRDLITADLEQRLPQITQSLLQVLLSPPPPRRLRRRSGGSSRFPPPRILARRPVLRWARRQPRPPNNRRRQRRQWRRGRRRRRRGRQTLRWDVIARQSDEARGGLERRQGRLPSLDNIERNDRFVNPYHDGRGCLLREVRVDVIEAFFLVIIRNVLGFECGLVELKGHRLASFGEDEILHGLGTTLDLDGVTLHLAWSLGVFRVSPFCSFAIFKPSEE